MLIQAGRSWRPRPPNATPTAVALKVCLLRERALGLVAQDFSGAAVQRPMIDLMLERLKVERSCLSLLKWEPLRHDASGVRAAGFKSS